MTHHLHTHPDRPRAVTYFEEHLVVWSLEELSAPTELMRKRVLANRPLSPLDIGTIAASRDHIAVNCRGDDGPTIQLFDWNDLQHVDEIAAGGPDTSYLQTALSDCGDQLAISTYEGEIGLYEIGDRRWKGNRTVGGWLGPLTYSPDGQLLAGVTSYQSGGRLLMLNADSGLSSHAELETEFLYWELEDTTATATFSECGRRVFFFLDSSAACGRGPDTFQGQVVSYDIETGDVDWTVVFDDTVTGEMLTSLDGPHVSRVVIIDRSLYVGLRHGVVVEIDVDDGAIHDQIDVADSPVVDLAASCDDRLIACVDERLFEVDSG